MPAGRKTQLRVLRGFDVPAEGRGFAALITMVRVVGKLNDAMAVLVKPYGLTSAHFDVLLTLKAGEGISQQELSERLLMTKGNACVTVQKMEAVGLIERRADPTDQRFQRLYMTDAGRKLLAKVMPEHQAEIKQMLHDLTLAEQKTLHELLLRVERTFDDAET
jgi:DNA-binding MarR family transcriptional regulator